MNVARNEVVNSGVGHTSSETRNPWFPAWSLISLVSALPIRSA